MLLTVLVTILIPVQVKLTSLQKTEQYDLNMLVRAMEGEVQIFYLLFCSTPQAYYNQLFI